MGTRPGHVLIGLQLADDSGTAPMHIAIICEQHDTPVTVYLCDADGQYVAKQELSADVIELLARVCGAPDG